MRHDIEKSAYEIDMRCELIYKSLCNEILKRIQIFVIS